MHARWLAGVAALLWAGATVAAPWTLHLLPSGDIGVLLALEVHYDGRRGLWLIDSGSSHNLVASERVPAPPAEARRERVTAAGGTLHGAWVDIRHFEVGDAPPGPLEAVRIDLAPVFGPLAPQLHGVLGRPFLDGRRWRFDLAARTLQPDAAPIAGGAALARVRGLPVLTLDLPTGRERFLFDSGAAGALVRLDNQAPPGLRVFRIDRVQIGGQLRGQVPLAELGGSALGRTLRGAVAGSAGMALLAGCAFTLDLVDDHLVVEHCASPTLPGGFGLQLTVSGGAVVLANVWPGSPAADAGLRAGDRVLSLAGQPVAGVPQGDAVLTASDKLAIEVSRAGQRHAATLERRYFLPLLRTP